MSSDPLSTQPEAAVEVRAEELTALVERLHHSQDRLSVGDVAETLGVPPQQVAAALNSIRRERVPPVALSNTQDRRRRHRVRRVGAFASAGFLLFGAAFWIGRGTGLPATGQPVRVTSASRSATLVDSSNSLAQQLRSALPAGVSITVGSLTYTGAPGSVYAGEDELVPLIEALLASESPDMPYATAGEKISASDLTLSDRKAAKLPAGFANQPTRLNGWGQTYEGSAPYRASMMAPHAAVDEFLTTSRAREARVMANRVTEWANVHARSSSPD